MDVSGVGKQSKWHRLRGRMETGGLKTRSVLGDNEERGRVEREERDGTTGDEET